MDKEPKTHRNKKSDKAQRNFDLHGTNSAKHVRQMEALMEKRAATATKPKK
jgi:hypothetical protein